MDCADVLGFQVQEFLAGQDVPDDDLAFNLEGDHDESTVDMPVDAGCLGAALGLLLRLESEDLQAAFRTLVRTRVAT